MGASIKRVSAILSVLLAFALSLVAAQHVALADDGALVHSGYESGALLPSESQLVTASDPVIVESLDGTATPTVRSIAVPYQTPKAPDIKLSSTDPVFEAGGLSYHTDAAWHYKKSDDTWAIMPGDQQFLEGAYRYHVCVMCPDENYTFADTATLIIGDETWTMIKKEKLSTGIEYALFASPEINLPDEQLDSPGPIKKTGDTLHDYGISWTKVDKAKGYEITVKNTTQGFAPKETTFEVSASTTTYDLKDVFKSLSIRTGHNTFIITVKALAPAGYKDSEPASSSTAEGSQWAFTVEKHLNLKVDSAAGTASWDPYPFEEAKYFYYRLVYGTPDGKQIVDGYYDSSITTCYIESNIEYFHGEAGKYYLYVIAMDRMKSNDGWELTEPDYVEYNYTPKVKTISVNGVKQPMEGDLAQAYIGDYSVEEANLSLPDPGSGSAYWRRHVSGSWVAMGPTEKFEASGEYRISIPVHCEAGYTFATDAKVSVNGKTVAAEIDFINETTVRIECPMDVIALNDSAYVVTAGALNVRSDASTTSERVGGLTYGDVVQTVGQNGGWTMIDFEGQSAWVNTSYLALCPSEKQPGDPFEDGPVKYTVTAGAMNVRSTPEMPSGDGNRIGGITAGTEILATGSVTDGEGRVWITMDYYDPSHPENGHRLGYVLFSRPNPASSSGTTYYFNGSELPPTKSSGKQDTASDELVIDTGSYPKVSFAPYKAVISVGNTASLTDENFENKDDGYLVTTVYPDDAMNFTSLTKDKVKLPEAFAGMEVKTLILNADGSVTLKLGPKDSTEPSNVSYTFTKGASGTWTEGSGAPMTFKIERTVDPETAFGHFTGILVDGKAVPEKDASGRANWMAKSGSVIVELQPSYLATLSEGAHTLAALFDDSDPVVADFTVEASTHTVTFDANGHGAAPAAQEVEDGKAATRPVNPTASGYIFGGWYTDKACTKAYGFSKPVTSDITLYAKWTAVHTVTFDANGHGTAPAAQEVEDGKKAERPSDPTASGYTFGGWYADKACTKAYDFSTPVTSDITLYAKWTAVHKVTFDANGHGTAPAAQEVEDGKAATRPANPTASGYTFGGWYADKACTKAYDFKTPVTEDITLYAKWTKKSTAATSPRTGDPTGGTVVALSATAAAALCLALLALRRCRRRG